MTYIDDILNLTEHSSDGLADERDSLEEAGLADEDVEEGLVDAHEFAESIEDGVGGSAGRDGCHALHLANVGGGGRHDIGESYNATQGKVLASTRRIREVDSGYLHLGEWTLA